MKRIFSLFVVAAMLLSAGYVFAIDCSTDLHDNKLTIVNTGATVKMTVVPQGIIEGGAKFRLLKVDVGQCINHTGTTAEAVVGIYDAGSASYWSNAFLECELESNDDSTATKTWVKGLKIYNGVLVVQGAYSVVTIEYENAV